MLSKQTCVFALVKYGFSLPVFTTKLINLSLTPKMYRIYNESTFYKKFRDKKTKTHTSINRVHNKNN